MGNLSKYGRYLGQSTVRWYAPPLSTLKWTRLCLPADHAANKLLNYHQKNALTRGNPWLGGLQAYGHLDGSVAFILINTGSSAYLHFLNDYAVAQTQLPSNSGYTALSGWVLDKTAKKFTFETYLDNDLEETSPSVIADDTQTGFWTIQGDSSGTITVPVMTDDATIKKTGANSLKLVNTSGGTYAGWSIYHNYSPTVDWSAQDFICLWMYGGNSGVTFRLILNSGAPNYRLWTFVDNFSGWKRLVFPLRNPVEVGGTFDPAAVSKIEIDSESTPNTPGTWYIDRVLVDTGQWCKAEIYVPDVLAASGVKFKVFAYNRNAGVYRTTPFLTDTAYNYGDLQYLAETNTYDSSCYPSNKGAAFYGRNTRGQVQAVGVGDTDAGSITYSSNYGVKGRIGFAVKMPPDDGLDASNNGVSQVRVKVEVYYGGDGEAAYEFENSTNQYYGLQNIDKQYLTVFKGAAAGAIDFLQLDTGLTVTSLTVTANHDEEITDVTMGFGGVTNTKKMFWGEDTVTNPNADTDADGIPDFIEGAAGTTGVEPFVDGGGWT